MRGQHVRAWLGEIGLEPRVLDARLMRNRFACLTGDSLKDATITYHVERLFGIPAPWELDMATWPNQSEPTVDQRVAERIPTTPSSFLAAAVATATT
jgi:hypothetical protein